MSAPRAVRGFRVAALLGLFACSPGDDPVPPGGLSADVQARLAPLLDPLATVLIPVTPCQAPVGPTSEQLVTFREPGGTTLVSISGHLQATVLVRPDGSLVPVGSPEVIRSTARSAPDVAPRAIPFGAGFLYARCTAERLQRITEVDASTGTERVIVDALRDCGPLMVPGAANDRPPVFGRGASPDHVVSAVHVGGQLLVAAAVPNALGSFDYASVLHTRAVGTPVDAVEVVFVEEISPGLALFLYRANATSPWVLGRTDGGDDLSFPTDAIPLSPRAEAPVGERFRLTTEALFLSSEAPSSARIVRIPIVASEAITTSAEASLPEGIGSWKPYGFGSALASAVTPSPEAPESRLLDVPVRYDARQLLDGAYVRTEAATTPCTSRTSCRLLGESTLLGVVGRGASAVAFYALWPWETQRVSSSGGEEGFGALVATSLRAGDGEPPLGSGGSTGGTGAGAGGVGGGSLGGSGGAAGTEAAGQGGAGAAPDDPITVLDGLVAPYDLTHRAGTLYFSTKGNTGPAAGLVARVATDGSGFAAISATESRPRDLAVDETGLYWTTSGMATDESDGTIRYATLGASPVLAQYAQEQRRPRSLVANSTSLAWVVGDENGAVQRMPKSAGNTPFPVFSGRFEGLAIDEAFVFAGVPIGNSVYFVELDNGSKQQVASPVSPLGSLRADGELLYWAGLDGVVQRSLKTPNATIEPVGAVAAHVRGFAVDEAWVYVASGTSLVALPKTGGAPRVLAVDQGEINGVTTDGVAVYWTSAFGDQSTAGAVRKLPRPTP